MFVLNYSRSARRNFNPGVSNAVVKNYETPPRPYNYYTWESKRPMEFQSTGHTQVVKDKNGKDVVVKAPNRTYKNLNPKKNKYEREDSFINARAEHNRINHQEPGVVGQA